MVNITSPDGDLNATSVVQIIDDLYSKLKEVSSQVTNISPAVSAIETPASFSSAVPQVTGLAAGPSAPGVITFTWNPSSIANLRYYQIYVDSDTTFPNPDILVWTNTKYDYTPPNPDLTYYIKVRAVNNENVFGVFSALLNSTTGLVMTEDIAIGASTNTTDAFITSFTPAVLTGNGSSAVWGSVTVTSKGRPVLMFAVLQATMAFVYTTGANRLTVYLRRGGVDILDPIIFDFTSPTTFLGGTVTSLVTVSFPNPLDDPPAGTNVYEVHASIVSDGTNSISVTPVYMTFTSLELRR